MSSYHTYFKPPLFIDPRLGTQLCRPIDYDLLAWEIGSTTRKWDLCQKKTCHLQFDMNKLSPDQLLPTSHEIINIELELVHMGKKETMSLGFTASSIKDTLLLLFRFKFQHVRKQSQLDRDGWNCSIGSRGGKCSCKQTWFRCGLFPIAHVFKLCLQVNMEYKWRDHGLGARDRHIQLSA